MGAGPSKEEEAPTQTQAVPPTNGHAPKRLYSNKASEDSEGETKIAEKATKDSSNSKPTRGPDHPTKKTTEVKEKITKKLVDEPKRAFHMAEAIVKEADDPSSITSNIHSGIFLKNKRKKFWVDEKTGHNCFLLLARDLKVVWGDDPRYWHWSPTCDEDIEVASLLNVCWLEVHGKLDVSYLTPNVPYEAVFLVMVKEPAYGWDAPVTLKLELADMPTKERNESLNDMPRKKWTELKVSEFTTSADQKGELDFSLWEYKSGRWKRGLIIKGIKIRPKK